MGTTLFIIFCFGLVISGIVFLGIQQAADWAKEDAAQKARVGMISHNAEVESPSPSSPAGRPLTNTHPS